MYAKLETSCLQMHYRMIILENDIISTLDVDSIERDRERKREKRNSQRCLLTGDTLYRVHEKKPKSNIADKCCLGLVIAISGTISIFESVVTAIFRPSYSCFFTFHYIS